MNFFSSLPYSGLVAFLGCILSLFASQTSKAQTPIFKDAIFGVEHITLQGNVVRIDSFDSSNGAYHRTTARANAVVRVGGGGLLSIGSSEIAGYVSAPVDATVFIGSNGTVGDRSFLDSGASGIQEGHRLTVSDMYFPEVEVPFTSGMRPLSNTTIFTPVVTTNFLTNSSTAYHPPAGTVLVITNGNLMSSAEYPAPGTYFGSVVTNWVPTTTNQYPAGYQNVETNPVASTDTVFPPEGTYVGAVTTTTQEIRSKTTPVEGTYIQGTLRKEGAFWLYDVYVYFFQQITSYTYYLPPFTWNVISGYSFVSAVYTTNMVGETFDYVFFDGNYQASALSGKVSIRGNAKVHVSGDINMTGGGTIFVEQGSSLEIFCSGNTATFGANGIDNRTGNARNVLYFGVPSNSSVRISASSVVAASIYAPQADVFFAGGGSDILDFMGSVVARSVTTSGVVSFHYDEALRNFSVNWEAPLVITQHPVSRAVAPNQIHFLSCNYVGSGPVLFQWWKDGVPLIESPSINAVNTSVLQLNAADLHIAGGYFLVLSNSTGAVTSHVATISIGQPPTITGLSDSKNILVGESFDLLVGVNGNTPLSYQWLRIGNPLAGKTNVLLTVSTATIADAGAYQVVVSNPFGAITSAVVNVVVGEIPSISSFSSDQSVTVGETINLNVAATGSAPFNYSWLRMGNPIVQQTNASLTIMQSRLADSGEYQVVVGNAFGAVTSSVANVVVGFPPSVLLSGDQLLVEGGNCEIMATVHGTAPFDYQWLKMEIPLEQETNTSLSLTGASLSQSGNYQMKVLNRFGTITSDVARVVVVGRPMPASGVRYAGEEITFTANVLSAENLAFQWRHNGQSVPNATNSTFRLKDLQPDQNGSYSVIVSDSIGSVISAAASLTVDGSPRITVQPLGGAFGYGESVALSVGATGAGGLQYTWKRDGKVIPNATNAILDLGNVTLSESGAYCVFVENGFGSATSESVVISVLLDAPQIFLQPEDQSAEIGSNVVFKMNAQSPAPMSCQWQFNNHNLLGETNFILKLDNVRFLQQGSYRCIVLNAAGASFTRVATLSVQPPTIPFLSAAGIYNGLFAQPTALAHDSAGFFTLKVKTNGRYSGKFLIDGDAVSKSGIFSSNGQAVATISRAKLGKKPLTVELQLSFDQSVIGRVTDGTWNSELQGFVSIISTNSVSGLDGKYTFLNPTIEGTPGFAPEGTGYALLNVRRAKITASGYLPDSERLKQSVLYSKNGLWPFYSRHYLGTNIVTNASGALKLVKNFRGSTLGWLTLSNQIPSGTLHWLMPANASRHFPTGLTNSGEIFGSSYMRPTLGRIINVTNGVLSFSGGMLAGDFSNSFFLRTNNTVQFTSTNKPSKLAFSPTTGAFSGNFVDGTNRIVFRGAMLQNRGFGAGYFSPTNGSGNVTVESAD